MQSAAGKIEGRYSRRDAVAKSHTICHGALAESSRWLSHRLTVLRAATTTTVDMRKVRPQLAAADLQIDRQLQRTGDMASEQT